jgi:uncharacterized protein with PIN domain
MSFLRKIKRKKLKADTKKMKSAFRGMTKRLNSLGDSCTSCSKSFDKADNEMVMGWSVYVNDGFPNLVCPECKQEIEKLKQEQREEIESDRTNETRSEEDNGNLRLGTDSNA